MSSSKPVLLLLGDPNHTIRWRVAEFEKFSSNFEIKVNEDLTRESFQHALRTKKYTLLGENA